jgi:hypothetical protein
MTIVARFKRGIILAGVIAASIAGGCRDEGRSGNLFEISGKLFVFNYRVATATYLVTLKPVAPLEEGLKAVALFENPAGGAPITLEHRIWPKLDKTVLESEPLRCVLKEHPYAVEIRIEDAAGEVRQVIRTTMTSNLDQDVLPDAPLVVGPVYTPNPDLVGRPNGKFDVTNEAGCPGRG